MHSILSRLDGREMSKMTARFLLAPGLRLAWLHVLPQPGVPSFLKLVIYLPVWKSV
jgi:hypothetical protein